MSSPAERAVALAFKHLGIDAILDPDNAALPVRLIPDQSSGDVQFGGLTVQDDRGLFEIQAIDLGFYGQGAVLLIGGERRVIQGTPTTPDRFGIKRGLNTAPEQV